MEIGSLMKSLNAWPQDSFCTLHWWGLEDSEGRLGYKRQVVK